MKVTLGKKQEKLNELEPITMIMFASLILNALQFLFPKLGSILSSAGRNLDSGIKSAEEGIKNAPIPEDKKQDFLQRLEAAKKDLQLTLQGFKDKAQDIQRKERPSAIIAQKVLVLVKILNEVRGIKELVGNKKVSAKLTEAEKLIRDVAKDLANLDLISALSSKKDPNGLWRGVTELQSSFKKNSEWLDFTASVARAVTNPESFETAKMPTVTKESNGLFKLIGDKFILSEGYGSIKISKDDLEEAGQLHQRRAQVIRQASNRKVQQTPTISNTSQTATKPKATSPSRIPQLALPAGQTGTGPIVPKSRDTQIAPAAQKPVTSTAIQKQDQKTISLSPAKEPEELGGSETARDVTSSANSADGQKVLPASSAPKANLRTSSNIIDAEFTAIPGTTAEKIVNSGVEQPDVILGKIEQWGSKNRIKFDKKKLGSLIPKQKTADKQQTSTTSLGA
jgi:hypothetical protein